MRIAVLSDIHGNLPALESVLAEVERASWDGVWCLGDVVGYGADPDRCADLVAERCSLCLAGNHDLAVLGTVDVADFSEGAAAAVLWTREHAADSTFDFLRTLSPERTDGEVALYHASPRDPVWEYVLWRDQAAECIEVQARRVSLIGHSHVALYFALPDPESAGADAAGLSEARGAGAGAGTRIEAVEGRWLINPGSVGQPRDGDPRAAWLELDTDEWTATYHRVEYDIDRAAAAIAATDLPEQLGSRLYVGA